MELPMKFIEELASFFNRRIPLYWIVFLYLALPNLPQFLAAHALGTMEHGFINIEFLLIAPYLRHARLSGEAH